MILLPAGWPLGTGNDIVSRGLAKGRWDLTLQVPVLYIYQTHTVPNWMVLEHAQTERGLQIRPATIAIPSITITVVINDTIGERSALQVS